MLVTTVESGLSTDMDGGMMWTVEGCCGGRRINGVTEGEGSATLVVGGVVMVDDNGSMHGHRIWSCGSWWTSKEVVLGEGTECIRLVFRGVEC